MTYNDGTISKLIEEYLEENIYYSWDNESYVFHISERYDIRKSLIELINKSMGLKNDL
jgi:hypothetical protein